MDMRVIVFLHVRACDRYYDPREAVRAAEVSTVERLQQCFEDLNCVNVCGLSPATEPENILLPRRGGLPV